MTNLFLFFELLFWTIGAGPLVVSPEPPKPQSHFAPFASMGQPPNAWDDWRRYMETHPECWNGNCGP